MLSRRGLTRTVQSLVEDVRLLEQTDGVLAAVGGGEGEETSGGLTLLCGGSNLGLMGIAPAYSLHPTPVRGEIAEMKQQIEQNQ